VSWIVVLLARGVVDNDTFQMPHEPDWITLGEDERRLVELWAADCAERVLSLFEAKAPSDARPREAIEGIRAFARGQVRKGQLRFLFRAAYAAAREVDAPSAAAARAASLAVSTAFMHTQITLDQAKHVLGPAAYAAQARELAMNNDPSAGDEEMRWAIEHASPAVLAVMRRMPVRSPGRGRLDVRLYQLDAGLRR
jgi:hypothetical protein